jgi:hypothetical protein
VAMKRSEAPKRKPGRPPRADRAEIESKVLAAIRVGLSLRKACLACGVPVSTVDEWIHEGSEFSDKAKAAIALRELRWLSELRESGHGWQRIAWLLERTCPEDYGRRDRLQAEVSGIRGQPIVIEIASNATPEEEAEAIVRALSDEYDGD